MINPPYPYLSENSSWYQFRCSSGSNDPNGPLIKPLVESMSVSENIPGPLNTTWSGLVSSDSIWSVTNFSDAAEMLV